MLILLLLASLSTSISASDLKVSAACNQGNASTTKDCFLHNLQCLAGNRVVVAEAEWRYKNSSANCSSHSHVVSCDASHTCCAVETGDCSAALTAAGVARDAADCWDGEACSLGLSENEAELSCGGGVATPPHYSLIRFFCVPKSAEVDFATSGAVTGTTASIRYRSTANQTLPGNARQQISFCRVESVDCVQHPVQVVVYTGNRRQACSLPYTEVVVGESQNCSDQATMKTMSKTTPFLVHLTVAAQSDVDTAWVALRATDESNVRVLCTTVDNSTLPHCVVAQPSTPPPIVDSKTNVTAMPGIGLQASVKISLIVVGCLLFACLLVIIILCYSRRLRKRSQMYETQSDYPVSMATYECWMEEGAAGKGSAPRDIEDGHAYDNADNSLPANGHLDKPDGSAEEPSEPPGVVD